MTTATTPGTRPADARTILAQIGGMTLAELGARDVVNLGDGVHFTVKRTSRYITKARVRLLANDTYLVEIIRCDRKTFDHDVTYSADGVYADSLSTVILSALGMV